MYHLSNIVYDFFTKNILKIKETRTAETELVELAKQKNQKVKNDCKRLKN